MAEPLDTTQLDLQNLSPEQAAALAQQQQAALRARQHHALLGMLGTVPELQKAGAAQYEQAGRERGAGQLTAANVLRQALGEKQTELTRQGLERQLEELKLQRAQFGELVKQHGEENDRADYEAYLRGRQTVPGGLVERGGKTAGELANIEAMTAEAGKIPIIGSLAAPVGRVLGMGKKSELAATEEEKRRGGYKTEPPLTFQEFKRAKRGGMVHSGASAPVAEAPAAAGPPGAHTHYRYNKDRTMRIPTDAAGNQLGPPEPNG